MEEKSKSKSLHLLPFQSSRAGRHSLGRISILCCQIQLFFFLFSLFESEPAPVKEDPKERLFFELLDCPYEEHCEYDHW